MKVNTKILPISINDLKDRYYDDIPLSIEEEQALANFDKYRVVKLNAVKLDSEFKLIYLKIQALANLSSYRFFLSSDFLEN